MKYLKHRIILYVLSFLLVGVVAFLVYSFQYGKYVEYSQLGILSLGLLVGVIIMYLINADKKKQQPTVITESSHTVLQSLQRVFKVVTAEGVFNEIYDYQQTKKLWNILPSTKKALVIIKGKAQMGYDFSKCQWEIDEENKVIKLIKFPEPELLSLETDFQYYNMEEKFYDLFSKEDLAQIQREGKKQLERAAYKSQLPETAAEQIETIIKEILFAKGWRLDNTLLLHHPNLEVQHHAK